MKILVSYRGIPQSPGWATGDMVVSAFRELGHNVFPYAKYYQQDKWVHYDAQPMMRVTEFDLLLFIECNDGDQQYNELKSIRARKTACWFFDTSYYPDCMTGLQAEFHFDYQFIANPLDVSRFPNGTYLPYACDTALHSRSLDTEKLSNISLIGSIRRDRRNLMDELEKHDVHLKLMGGVFREEYINLLASSYLVLNQNPNEGRGLLNMRFWEAQAAGAILLTEASDMQFNIDAGLQHTACYPYMDIDDIVTVYHTLFNDPVLLRYTAEIGQERILKHHTYKNRCEQILDTVFPHERK